jgi:hypothetical protein
MASAPAMREARFEHRVGQVAFHLGQAATEHLGDAGSDARVGEQELTHVGAAHHHTTASSRVSAKCRTCVAKEHHLPEDPCWRDDRGGSTRPSADTRKMRTRPRLRMNSASTGLCGEYSSSPAA